MPTYTIFNKGCVFDDFPLVGCILGVDVPTFWWSKNKMFGDIVPTVIGHTKRGDNIFHLLVTQKQGTKKKLPATYPLFRAPCVCE